MHEATRFGQKARITKQLQFINFCILEAFVNFSFSSYVFILLRGDNWSHFEEVEK